MKTVAVIFGGRSAEHDVSIVTALASIVKPLSLQNEYEVLPIYIAKDGAWYSSPDLTNITVFTSGKVDQLLPKLPPLMVQFDGGMRIGMPAKALRKPTFKQVDIVFPAMHGTYGEDGALMGLLEMAGVPYVGCGVAAAAIAMDKALAKQVAWAAGVPVTPFITSNHDEVAQSAKEVVKRVEQALRYPVFVKPAHLGSSIGISKAKDKKELLNALEVAAHYDDKIIIEEAVANLIEVTLPIIGNSMPRPALLEQPLTQAEDFFDFDTKYMQGGKKGKGQKGAHGYSQVPADLPKRLYEKAEAIGLDVYKALGCSGIARVDMLIDGKSKQVYFNEVNPLPGGLYAHNWARAGVSGVQLVEQLLQYALEQHEHKGQLTTTFDTNYLKQF